MPVIAKFYGMIIKMYFQQREHIPPHIHAVYGEYMGAVDIKTLNMLEGDLPPKALALVQEWTKKHQDTLLKMWNSQQFSALPPLE
ncbi:MAG: DUF4160 domain-containing protein [Candidatus Electronema sp. VV]